MQIQIQNAVAAALLMNPELQNRKVQYAAWTRNFVMAAAAVASTQEITMDSAYDALLIGATRVVTNAAGTTFSANGPVLVMIRDTSTSDNITDQPTPLDNIFGTAQNPMIFPWPRLVKASGTVSTIMDNLDAANAFTVRITYHGVKVFKPGTR